MGGTSPTGSNRWQDIDYRYNIRGWLLSINDLSVDLRGVDAIPPAQEDDLFAFQIVYENFVQGANPHAQKLYNGNIAQTFWKTGVDNTIRGYSYQYDELNRLLSAVHHNPHSNNKYSGAYNEHISYDLNGNIRFLTRNTGDASSNSIGMDDLTYTYKNGYGNSNQLVKVTDAVSSTSTGGFIDGYTGTLNDYEYDDNGNMIVDRNKGISEILYNHLNLPTYIYIDNKGVIEYLYNAAGQKVQKRVYDYNAGTDGMITDVKYLDGYQYAGDILQFFPHPEGYVRATPLSKAPPFSYQYDYVYNYTDHLDERKQSIALVEVCERSSVRVSYTQDPVNKELKILEENHYYPFGLKHAIYDTGGKKDYKFDENDPEEIARPGFVYAIPYQYKYNGKELQDELGLGWYDYQARNYDPALGRWMNVDPLAPKYFSHSPYAYALNNPVYFIDPDGMQVLGSGDPEDPEEDKTVHLEEAVITGKPKNNSSNTNQSKNWAHDLDALINRSFFGYNYEAYSILHKDPAYRAEYEKMYRAKREGEWFVVGMFGAALAPAILPEIISFGSIKIFSTKAAISATAQIVVNGDVDLVDVAADATLIPGVSGAVGGAVNYRISDQNLEINTDPNSILINSAISLMSGGMGGKFNSAIKQMPNGATQTAAEVMIKTPHAIVEQSLNKNYGNKNK